MMLQAAFWKRELVLGSADTSNKHSATNEDNRLKNVVRLFARYRGQEVVADMRGLGLKIDGFVAVCGFNSWRDHRRSCSGFFSLAGLLQQHSPPPLPCLSFGICSKLCSYPCNLSFAGSVNTGASAPLVATSPRSWESVGGCRVTWVSLQTEQVWKVSVRGASMGLT